MVLEIEVDDVFLIGSDQVVFSSVKDYLYPNILMHDILAVGFDYQPRNLSFPREELFSIFSRK